MRIITLDKHSNEPLPPCVATIGFFDGVHRGHRFLIDDVKAEAAKTHLPSLVITFDRHPRQVLQQAYQPQLLTTLDEKLRLLASTGVDDVAVLHFTREMASLSAREFMEEVLRRRLNVKTLVTGYDNRFGHNRAEGFDDYVAYGRELGINVVKARALSIDGLNVSSSVVRAFLNGGEVEMAARCLGRPYSLSGRVVRGFQQGRKMGFPTANIDPGDNDILIPEQGVYAVVASVDGLRPDMQAMMDIGSRPTFGGAQQTLEVNIFNFDGNLYGRHMKVELIKRMRDDRKFASIEALKAQLKRDKQNIEALFASNQIKKIII